MRGDEWGHASVRLMPSMFGDVQAASDPAEGRWIADSPNPKLTRAGNTPILNHVARDLGVRPNEAAEPASEAMGGDRQLVEFANAKRTPPRAFVRCRSRLCFRALGAQICAVASDGGGART